MKSNLIGIPSRAAFLICGIISFALSRMYLALIGFDPAYSRTWYSFSAVLTVLGGLAVLIALIPGAWIAKTFKVNLTENSLVPLKTMGVFAGVGYAIILALSLAPHSFHPGPQFVLSVCPACALTITVDPSLPTVLLFLAPLSAAVYGALGGELGYLSVVLHKND